MPCLNEIQSSSAEAQIKHNTKGDRGEATAAIHCVFQLTGTQSWDAPGTGRAGEARNNVAASLGPVCCGSTWQVSAAPCFLFLSSELYILKGFSILTRGMQRV